MKPFDLEQAKAGAPIVTRGGKTAKFIAHVPIAQESNRVVAMFGGVMMVFRETGRIYESDESPYDLFMATVKNKFQKWMNLYSNGDTGVTFDTEEDAKAQAMSGLVETRLIEWEVEQ